MKRTLTLLLCLLLLLTGCQPANPLNQIAGTTSITFPSVATPSIPPISSLDSNFEVHFIDVGQADAALIKCDNRYALIDGGNSEDSSLIYTYLKKQNVSHLDYIVATHGHEDHVGGLSGALNAASVGTALCSVTEYDNKAFQNFVKNLEKQEKTITVPEVGYTFNIGTAVATVLGPISESDDPNNMSLVIRISYGETSFLFTGDAEYPEETEILDSGTDISCTVLKVGHHGSSSSTSYRWLREAAPEYAVISVGTENEYGHPTEAALSRLRDADVKTYRTDMQGDIICTSDGINVSFQVSRNPNADTLSGSGGGHVTTPTDPTFPSSDMSNTEDTTVATEPTQKLIKYICNTNTKKFHYPSCSSAKKIAQKNRKEVESTREELIAEGYDPCGHCDP